MVKEGPLLSLFNYEVYLEFSLQLLGDCMLLRVVRGQGYCFGITPVLHSYVQCIRCVNVHTDLDMKLSGKTDHVPVVWAQAPRSSASGCPLILLAALFHLLLASQRLNFLPGNQVER